VRALNARNFPAAYVLPSFAKAFGGHFCFLSRKQKVVDPIQKSNCDLLNAIEALCQLSYEPKKGLKVGFWRTNARTFLLFILHRK